jgi:hypothetical protein
MSKVYLKPGQTIGCSGYTDLTITEGNGIVNDVKLQSTEGGELDYFDEENDRHHEVILDMDGTPETNPNYGKFYYENDEDDEEEE